MVRATKSVEPAAGKGVIKVTGRTGYSCACNKPDIAKEAAPARIKRRDKDREVFKVLMKVVSVMNAKNTTH